MSKEQSKKGKRTSETRKRSHTEYRAGKTGEKAEIVAIAESSGPLSAMNRAQTLGLTSWAKTRLAQRRKGWDKIVAGWVPGVRQQKQKPPLFA